MIMKNPTTSREAKKTDSFLQNTMTNVMILILKFKHRMKDDAEGGILFLPVVHHEGINRSVALALL